MANKIESGVQLFQRINNRPDINGIHEIFKFEDNPDVSVTFVEISDGYGLLSNNFVMDLLMRAILPSEINFNNGSCKNCSSIIINTAHRFNLLKFVALLKKTVKAQISCENDIKRIVENALERLTVLNCYSHEQLHMTILNIENIILSNSHIGLLIIDSLSAFYWSNGKSNTTSINSYKMKLFSLIYSVVGDLNVSLIYCTVPSKDNFSVENVVKREHLNRFCKIVFFQNENDVKATVSKNNEIKIYICNTSGETFFFINE